MCLNTQSLSVGIFFERYKAFSKWRLIGEIVSLEWALRVARLTLLPVHALQMNAEAACLATACSCHDVSPQNTNQIKSIFPKVAL